MSIVRRKMNMLCGIAFAVAGGVVAATPSAAQVIDLAGQTVTLIHNAAPGGSTGLGSQLAAEAWAKTMAGNPTIVVQSVEGGALSKGILQVMNSRPDGKTVGWVAWSGATRVLDPVELQIPFKDFGLIGGVGGAYFFVHADTKLGGGIKNKDEFVEKVKSFTFGGFNAKSASSMRTAGAMDMLGVPYKFVSGFNGDAPLFAAMQRGEIEGYPATGVTYNRSLKNESIAEGKSLGLFYFTPVGEDGKMIADPLMPELEPFDAYYTRVKGEAPSGPIWDMMAFHGRTADKVNWLVVAPPGTPEEHLQMLRESFAKAMEDPDFIAGAERVFGQKPVVTTFPEISEIVEEVSGTPQALLDTMRGYLEKMEQ